MTALGELLVAPFQNWDAVVCTSRAVQEMVDRVLDFHADYLAQRVGGREAVLPQRPIIPLGVDCEALAPSAPARARGRALRQRIGISGDAFVVLSWAASPITPRRIPFLSISHSSWRRRAPDSRYAC